MIKSDCHPSQKHGRSPMPDDDIKSLTKAVQRREYGTLPEAINLIGDTLETVHFDMKYPQKAV